MKYETTIDFENANTMTIMIDEIKENSVVLEFGPANGRLTKYLKEEKNCEVYIVEIDEEAGLQAAKYAKDYVIGDIETYEWADKFNGVKFDYILFADVLEHLRNPENVIVKVKEFLNETGAVIVSLPNIAHNSVLIDLFNGRFEYKNTGLLDNTHIRFWTYENIEAFFKNAELFVDKRYATYTQVGFNEFNNTYDDIPNIAAFKTREMGEVYQFVYVVKKVSDVENADYINRSNDYYYAQWFYIDAKEIKEEHKKILDFTKDKRKLFNISVNDGIKTFRFDPLNKRCIIKINSIEVNGQPFKEIELVNGELIGDYAFFYNDDNQIIFYLEEEKNNINLDIEYFELEYCESSAFKEIILNKNIKIKELSDITVQKENYICELREILCKKEKEFADEINKKENINAELTKQNIELENKNDLLYNIARKSLIGRILLKKYNVTKSKEQEK